MDNLTSTLLVTVIGMAVVFVAMSLFFASMHLLTALAKDKPEQPVQPTEDNAPTPPPAASDDSSIRRRAAAVAVALARAQLERRPPAADAGSPEATPWGDYYRQRQLRPSGRGRIA